MSERMNVSSAATEYGLHIAPEIEGRLRRSRASVREAIRKGLTRIAASAGNGPGAPAFDPSQPRLSFYLHEGYCVAYRIDFERRRVVLLDIESMPSD